MQPPIDPSLEELQIREELTKLQLARLKLKHFITYVDPRFRSAKHQDMIIEKLEKVEQYIRTKGKEGIGRLIINIPPRHGKTYTCSNYFPAWVLGRNPDTRVILASYGASLAEKASRDLREVVEKTEFQKVFGAKRAVQPGEITVQVDPEGRSIQSWEIKDTLGVVVAAGVDGPILGRGADLFVLDDPHKGREEAESEIIRENVWKWFVSSAYSRLHKGGAMIIIMQRWHEEDIVGKLLADQPEKWDTLILPAIAEENDPMGRAPGEPLWPEDYPLEKLNDIRRLQPPRDWNSMYQQHPSGAEGDTFKREWFTFDRLPHPEEIAYGFQVWDCAMTEKQTGDYSACCTFYVTKTGLFLADVFRSHMDFPTLKRTMEMKYDQWSKFYRISRIFIEDKVAGTSVLQALRKDTHLPVIALQPQSELGRSKLQRANSATGYIHSGRVSFLRGAPWLPDFEEELLKFPRGKHDDMVDAFVYGVLQVRGGGQMPRGSFQRAREIEQSKGMSQFFQAGASNRHSAILGEW